MADVLQIDGLTVPLASPVIKTPILSASGRTTFGGKRWRVVTGSKTSRELWSIRTGLIPYSDGIALKDVLLSPGPVTLDGLEVGETPTQAFLQGSVHRQDGPTEGWIRLAFDVLEA